MTDIRCPMCSKLNPAEAEVCQYCQARLKPVLPPAEKAGAGAELPDWLNDFRQQGEEAESPEIVGEPGEEQELPDWLSSLGQEPAREQESELPDWLKDIGAGSGEGQKEAESSQTQAFAEEGEPDWLQRIRTRAREEGETTQQPAFYEEEPSEPAPEETTAIPSAMPDWLTELMPEESVQPQDQSSAPDWLAGGRSEALPFTLDAEELAPDWLAQEPGGEAQAEAVEAEPEAGGQETPDWLSGIDAGSGVPAFTSLDEEDTDTLIQAEEKAAPEWLEKLKPEVTEPASTASVPAFTFGEDETEWAALREVAASQEAEQYVDEVPDWLSQVTESEAAVEIPEAQTEAEGEAENGELAPALLPGWLEAMRPVEAVAPTILYEDVSSEQLETAGPLSGLRGVLASQSGTLSVRKAPAQAIRLRISEGQQARVALLTELLESEDKAKPIPSHPVITPQYVFRLVIALLLLLPIFGVTAMSSDAVPMPSPAKVPLGVSDLFQQVAGLPGGAPIAVAFDYEAGYSGEMEAAAGGVISILADRGAYLTILSTSPSGALLAERLIGQLNNQAGRSEFPFTNYTNLGFLPGGTAGLKSFAEAPSRILPFSLSNYQVWTAAPLNGISTLADFAAVLVITDNPDTARAWIEQTKPVLEEKATPLLMIVSAQAEPLVQPYFIGAPRQVEGLIAGMAGGAAFESLAGQPGLARKSWDAYSAGLLITCLLIFFGGISAYLSTGFVREKKGKG